MNKNLAIIISGRVLQVIIMLVSIRVMTYLLSPTEMGNYYLAITILAFLNLVFLNPPGMYFSRHVLQWQRSKNLFNAITVFMAWMCVVSLLSIPIVFVIFEICDYHEKYNVFLFTLFTVLAMLVSTTHRNTMHGTNALGFRTEFVVFLIGTLLLGLTFSITSVLLYGGNPLWWLFGVIAAEALMLVKIFRFFIQNNTLDINKIRSALTQKRLAAIMRFTLPIGVATFLMWGQNMSYRFIVDYKYTADALGYIAVGLGISTAVFNSLESILMQYFNPLFLKDILDASQEERAKAWNKMASFMVPIYVSVLFFTIALSEVLMKILVDSQFQQAYVYAMIGASMEFFRVMTNLLNNVAQSEHKTSSTIKPYCVGFIVSVTALLLFNFEAQLAMVPVVLSAAYGLVFVFMYVEMKKILAIKIQVDIVRSLLWALPFFAVYLLPQFDGLIPNMLIAMVFGGYFLLSTWLPVKHRIERNG